MERPSADAIPRETLPRSDARQIRQTILGVLAFVLAVNVVLSAYLTFGPSRNLAYRVVADKWAMLLDLQEPVDWLVLGDSTCNQGVDPDIIKLRSGMTALNLCTLGDMLVANDAWMLDTYVQRFGAPRVVLIVHALDEWPRDFEAKPIWTQLPLGAGFWAGLQPDIGIDTRIKAQLLFQKALTVYWETTSLQDLVFRPWRDPEAGVRRTPSGFMAVQNAAPAALERAAAERRAHPPDPANHPFSLSSENLRALERIKLLADTYGFQVWFATSPLYEGFLDTEMLDYLAKMEHFFRAFVADSSRLHYILATPMTFPATQMQGGDHVTAAGAPAYTTRILELVGGTR